MRKGSDENSGKILRGNLEENRRSHNQENFRNALMTAKGVFVESQQWV